MVVSYLWIFRKIFILFNHDLLTAKLGGFDAESLKLINLLTANVPII